ncbi:MAG: hypothetical protein ABSG97_01980 [Sedimentisphaerales bacterium]|jgi:predicted nucleic-acid-binding Zn-ribbon protein
MAVRAKNNKEITSRGGYTDNARLYILKCNRCGSYALYDEEISFIFLNPDDLSQRALYGLNISETVNCPNCGAPDSFDEAPDGDEDKILQSPWGFTLAKKT